MSHLSITTYETRKTIVHELVLVLTSLNNFYFSRYYLQLMTEASCVEWAVVVAVVLRDALAVLRTTNAARGNDVSLDAVRRLRRALQDICAWTDAEWYVMISFKNPNKV